MADRIQQRRDTAARWAQFNPILLEGEVGYVTDDPNQYKIGDGVHAWNNLPLRGFDGTLVHELGNSQTAAMSQQGVTTSIEKYYVSKIGLTLQDSHFDFIKEVYVKAIDPEITVYLTTITVQDNLLSLQAWYVINGDNRYVTVSNSYTEENEYIYTELDYPFGVLYIKIDSSFTGTQGLASQGKYPKVSKVAITSISTEEYFPFLLSPFVDNTKAIYNKKKGLYAIKYLEIFTDNFKTEYYLGYISQTLLQIFYKKDDSTNAYILFNRTSFTPVDGYENLYYYERTISETGDTIKCLVDYTGIEEQYGFNVKLSSYLTKKRITLDPTLVENATQAANQATQAANQATQAANNAADTTLSVKNLLEDANTALAASQTALEEAQISNEKIDQANTVASQANTVASQANTVASQANTVASQAKSGLEEVKQTLSGNIAYENLSEPLKQIIESAGGGSITNNADDEDLTVVDNKLKFADRNFSISDTLISKGQFICRKNKSLSEQMIYENTIYVINYLFDLGDSSLLIPKNCALEFAGGIVTNGTIEGNDTVIINNSNSHIFDAITLTGSFICDYFTPDWFGAVGDGVTDDTDKLAYALKMSNDLNYIPVKFLIGKKYYVTDSINYYNGEYHDLVLNLVGCLKHRDFSYSVSKVGGIKLANGTALFKNKTIRGNIQYLNIVGVRNESVHIFDNCDCKRLNMNQCTIANVGAVFYDSSLTGISEIKFCIFLTAFWFARNVNTGSTFVDSSIHHNYINGGEEPTENTCFMWSNFNGSTIHDNFIDYYRAIYMPTAITAQAFGNINSIGNNYQVFRYFFIRGNNVNQGSISSVSDIFNWTNPERLEKLTTYKALKYTGRDSNEYDIPPCIGIVYNNSADVFQNVIIESNVGNILFVRQGIAQYNYSVFKFSVNKLLLSDSVIQFPQGHTLPIYNGGQYPYMHNFYDIENVIEKVDALPTINLSWSARPIGHKVFYKNAIWKATLEYDKDTESYTVSWQPQN